MADNFGSDYITIVDEDGEEFELEVLMTWITMAPPIRR